MWTPDKRLIWQKNAEISPILFTNLFFSIYLALGGVFSTVYDYLCEGTLTGNFEALRVAEIQS